MNYHKVPFLIIVLCLVAAGVWGVLPANAVKAGKQITPRQLIQPGALMGTGPSAFAWSPSGALLAYVEPQDGQDALWLYDAASGEKQVLFAPGDNPDGIDLTLAQWSPQGHTLLLPGADALWLLEVAGGGLHPLVTGQGITSMTFSPDGWRVAYAQHNDLYMVEVADGAVTRLTFDGSETVFNGTLDWVYNEELATRSAQPAYAWSPDGKWLIHLRLDEVGVQNHSVTDYRTVPPTLSYTRYPTAGTANPAPSLHLIDLQSGQSTLIPLPDDAEYVLPFFAWFPDSQEAVYVIVNRAHTRLELLAYDVLAGSGRSILQETDPAWVNENSYAAPLFLGDGGQFLWLSERDGFMHLYLYSRQGDLLRQVTQGAWMIDTPAWNLLVPGRPVYLDPAGEWAYFYSNQRKPAGAAYLPRAHSRRKAGETLRAERLSLRRSVSRRPVPGGPVFGCRYAARHRHSPLRMARRVTSWDAAPAQPWICPTCSASSSPCQPTTAPPCMPRSSSRRLQKEPEIPGHRPLVCRANAADGFEPLRQDQPVQPHRARCALHPGRLHRLAAG